jgi:thymidylate kinase
MVHVESDAGTSPLVPSTSPRPTGGPAPIPALLAVLDDLAAREVAHCSWKSNEHLAAALAGETDLDLLVDHGAISDFHAVAARHRLKYLVPPPSATYPGMEHLLGFDEPSGRLFHLHVHYQLVLGEQFVKNHRLPIERDMLRDTELQDGVRVAGPELELAVLAIRALLKYRARDFVKDLLGIRGPGVPDAIFTELRWLRERTDDAAVRSALSGCRALPTEVVCEFLAACARSRRPAVTLLRLRHRTRVWLGHDARVSRAHALVTYYGALARRHRRRPTPRMTPLAGGGALALVGADGAGKSTLARAGAQWLGWKVETRIHYLGSKPPSRAARWSYGAFRALRRSERAASARFGSEGTAAHLVREARDTALAAHHLATGCQRARAYADARRDTAQGRIVVLDRFPCGALASAAGGALLDGPRIAATLETRNRLIAGLAKAEARLYRRFSPPESIVVLDVDPTVAAARKPDHDIVAIRAKTSVAAGLSGRAGRPGPRIVALDANRPFELVLGDVKKELWRVL